MAATIDIINTSRIEEEDEEDEYEDEYGGAFRSVSADIVEKKGAEVKKIGHIYATVVDRSLMRGRFLTTMDEKSASLQQIGIAIFEPKNGQTRLQSLAATDDKDSILVIDKLHVDDDYKKDGASDVGATAIRKFLSLPEVIEDVSCAVYEVDPREAMTKEELTAKEEKDAEERHGMWMGGPSKAPDTAESIKKEEEEQCQWQAFQHADANQFLRVGFFQDRALAKSGHGNFLVATHAHWCRDMLSHEQAKAIAFFKPAKQNPKPTGKDSELQKAVIDGGADMEKTVKSIVEQGGSIARSFALHAATATDSKKGVLLLLRLDRDACLNSIDSNGQTPLMIAAGMMAGKSKKDESAEVLDILLAAGADRSIQNSGGMTAYGVFQAVSKEYQLMMETMTGRKAPVPLQKRQYQEEVTEKLLPPEGPSAADKTGGNMEGLVQFDE
ncbi:expressed unknown protein [Seminavis robusta]|uniref:Uncharacterized protein n=1 Tax=Seminavis robusta TaxID=568900 RepID=A0A9N8E1N3_9STRA|nr:expressed unknown protein [Seminavis robusta]|eukprot:Sro561_g166880.1 n/a (441) ;mRNA; f:52734-54056